MLLRPARFHGKFSSFVDEVGEVVEEGVEPSLDSMGPMSLRSRSGGTSRSKSCTLEKTSLVFMLKVVEEMEEMEMEMAAQNLMITIVEEKKKKKTDRLERPRDRYIWRGHHSCRNTGLAAQPGAGLKKRVETPLVAVAFVQVWMFVDVCVCDRITVRRTGTRGALELGRRKRCRYKEPRDTKGFVDMEGTAAGSSEWRYSIVPSIFEACTQFKGLKGSSKELHCRYVKFKEQLEYLT